MAHSCPQVPDLEPARPAGIGLGGKPAQRPPRASTPWRRPPARVRD